MTAPKARRGKAKTLPGPAPRGPNVTKARIMKAIQYSGAIKSVIAKRLDVGLGAVERALARPDWPEVAEAFREERERVADFAESTIQEMITQRLDFGEAARNARWYLERKCPERGFQERKTLELNGGDNPIKIRNEATVSIGALNLDLDTRKKLLEAIEQAESGPIGDTGDDHQESD